MTKLQPIKMKESAEERMYSESKTTEEEGNESYTRSSPCGFGLASAASPWVVIINGERQSATQLREMVDM